MEDPIKDVIESIKKQHAVIEALQKDWLKSSFLNNIGDIFENHPFEVSRRWLIDKSNQTGMRGQAEALLAVLDCMETVEYIRRKPAVGRLIIKTLNSLKDEIKTGSTPVSSRSKSDFNKLGQHFNKHLKK